MNKQKINWVNFLHFYLPPTTNKEIVDEAVQRSYGWILLMAEKYPTWNFTLNITGCLIELLVKYNHSDILDRIKKLVDKGQVEIVGSLSHHAIAPLLPREIIQRQIEQQVNIIKKYFAIEPKGFFLPEMAYNTSVAKLLNQFGYQWLLLDEIHMQGKFEKIDMQCKYIIENTTLSTVFRSRDWSQSYPPKNIIQNIHTNTFPKILITATDAELYGHRFVDWEGWLGKILESSQIQTSTISSYLDSLQTIKKISPIAGNWESLEKEIKNKFPFPLWQHRKNRLHTKLWKLAHLAIYTLQSFPHDINYEWAQKHLDNGLASCTFWWASGRDFKLFGSPAWHPDEVEKGALELVKVIRTINVDKKIKLKAEKIFHSLKYLLWKTHWNNYESH